jgi:hypothetical protein
MTETATITRPQELQLELLRLASFNDFDGDRVADSLLKNRDLWIAFLLDREAYSAEYRRREILETGRLPIAPIDTIRLRDLAAGHWNVDALFILPASECEDKLFALAHTWHADEIDWYDPLDAGSIWLDEPGLGGRIIVQKMLRVWWD